MPIHKGLRSHQACLQHTQELVKMCQQLGSLVNLERNQSWSPNKTSICGLPVRPQVWSGPTDSGPVAGLISLPACPVREFMPLIGLLSAKEKQVHLGRLHIRPSQWHHCKVPESLEKVIPITRSLHPHLQWRLKEDNVLTSQPLHPI